MNTQLLRVMRTLALIFISVFVVFSGMSCKRSGKEDGRATVKVERRDIIQQALAVGTIDPENEIHIKSKNSGVVQRIFIEAGSYVVAGTPLLEIRPDPTPLEQAEAQRHVEIANLTLQNAKNEFQRQQQLKGDGLISQKDFEDAETAYEEAKIRKEMAIEKQALLEKGKVTIANKKIETVVKAPTSGYILEKLINVGDPIVPLTSYQEGTALFTMADMNHLLFKGTVDEIDVGKLIEGMPAEIQVGALPGKAVFGTLYKISLKARKENNATVFPVEINVEKSDDVVLRAGYSANANIIIQKKKQVLALPERVVFMANDSSWVEIQEDDDTVQKVYIKTGLSDAIYIEVLEGLIEEQAVLEKESKEII
ncbi:efflux RND transporter periplasmic adaptor subunit [bacterium]|nr:efflux RND transporter periplasmic adaptor subunit [bacterium]